MPIPPQVIEAGIMIGSKIIEALGGMSAAQANLKGVRETNQMQMDLYNKQVQDNRENWNMQNEYNTPGAQMQRLQDAGLNPNLIYGSGSSNTGVSTSQASGGTMPQLSTYQMPTNLFKPFADIVPILADLRQKDAATNEIQARTYLTHQESQKKILEVIAQGYANAKSEKEVKIYDKMLENQLAIQQSQIDHYASEIGLKKQQRHNLFIEGSIKHQYGFENARLTNEQLFKNSLLADANREKIFTEIKGILSNINVNKAKIQEIAATISNKAAEYQLILTNNNYRRSELGMLNLKKKEQEFNNWCNDYLRSNGIDLREKGWSGQVGKWCHNIGNIFTGQYF